MKKKTTNIELTDDDAVLFAQFQKRYSFVALMESLKVFDIRNGSITIHFDKYGGIGKIKREEFFQPDEK